MNIKFPLQFDHRGRTAESSDTDHIREMIEQVLFTSPGERVNRPEFGCGIMQLLFAPNSDQMAAALQASIQASLNRWLGDLIEVHDLEVTSDDARLQVNLQYIVTRTGEPRLDTFERRAVA
ncbi:GPW/gp25 family protein [Rhodopirellula maiorica SM1]|uniref:GPW/gp25 family protein n=1 Tax=Rhodopirellula maiorica SM1 TaxID=1265738 RepID=M5RRM4_9BACT|nr:GPW/gp25 family protein [Rhodopirellula maiorica]EMI21993.1 GPW/gp25 family protein [Rhodopirellula maiorica SM1]